ncbi:MAG TPA: dTMP kinase [Planctomycetota bacterium]|nr:dTMP kinase [Planctomycetota bacterium]
MWIDFEGIDGSGKSAVSVRLARHLRETGFRVTHVRETGAFRSPIPRAIRDLTRNPDSARLSPEAELLLNCAREAQVLHEEVRPALTRGELVLTDRALHSHLAAAAARGLPPAEARPVASFAAGGLWPDLIVLVDVDPDIARLRRRIRKIREMRYGSSSRKSLLGQAFIRRTRDGLREMARTNPDRWRVLENSAPGLEAAVQEARALVAPLLKLPADARPRRAELPRIVPSEDAEGWIRAFFDYLEALFSADPGLGTLLSAGIDDPRADALREAAVRTDPDIAAWATAGLDTPSAWAVRRAAAERMPGHAARSLVGLDGPEAWAMRRELAPAAPAHVLHSLGGLTSAEAHALRGRLWDEDPDEALGSLKGLQDPAAWAFRHRAWGKKLTPALVESVEGLTDAASWELRAGMAEAHPVPVLRSLKGVDDPRAWALRRDLAGSAPRAVLASLGGLDGADATALREALRERCPDEVAASLAGLASFGAWRLRNELLGETPAGVLRSLATLEADPLAALFAARAIAAAPGSPRAARRFVNFQRRRLATRGSIMAPS